MTQGFEPSPAFLARFTALPDPRQRGKVLHPLRPLPELLCSLVGGLCAANGWVEVEEYSTAKLGFLHRFLPFEHGVASHDTFSHLFNALDRDAFAAASIAWVQALQKDIREIIAVNGKTPRRSVVRPKARASAQRLVLGQTKVADKSNSISADAALFAKAARLHKRVRRSG